MRWVSKKLDGSFEFIKSSTKPNSNAQLMEPLLWNENEEYLVVSESEEIDAHGASYTKYSVALDLGTKDAREAEKAAALASKEAYNALTNDIATDGAITAGTTNPLSGIMDMFTYIRMKERPELFDNEGLVAKKDVGSFVKGDALNTILKVEQYADAMIAESDAFLIRRMKKITDYIIGE